MNSRNDNMKKKIDNALFLNRAVFKLSFGRGTSFTPTLQLINTPQQLIIITL